MPQSFYPNVVDGVASLVEVISNSFVSAVFNVRKVFSEGCVQFPWCSLDRSIDITNAC